MLHFPSKSFNRLSKKHCQQNLSCKHCCQCWIKYKKSYQVTLKNKNQQTQDLKSRIKFLENLNKNLTRELNLRTKQLSKFQSPQIYQQNLKEQLAIKLKKQFEVELQMKTVKIDELFQQIKQYSKKLSKMTKQNKKVTEELESYKQLTEEQKNKIKQHQDSIQYLTKQNEQISQKYNKLIEQNMKIQQQLQNKTVLISKMQQLMKNSQNLYVLQKNKASNYQFQKNILQINIKNKDDYIEKLTKCSQDNIKSIGTLTTNNRHLKDMVSKMDVQIKENLITQGYLKQRLIWTESMADFQTWKVRSMKNDLRQLKMTL